MKWDPANAADLLRPELNSGEVHLNDRRALVLDAESLARLKQRLIESEGIFAATRMIWNFSYASGYQEAVSIKRSFSPKDKVNWFGSAATLLALRGFAKVENVQNAIAKTDSSPLLEVEWSNSWEIDDSVGVFDKADIPGCPTVAGYLSGFASAVTEENIIFLETECRGRGDGRCFAIARSDWKDEDKEVQLLAKTAEGRSERKFSLSTFIAENSPTIERIQQLVTEIEAQKAEIDVLQNQVQYLQEVGSGTSPVRELIGTSRPYKKALRDAQKVAPTDSTVLIQGETGTGKELFARYIHANSQLNHRPLITVNCAALPLSLVESELFGHEKGAFTGAVQRKLGRFEIASGATIFLDEVGELPLETQVKFLRVLQEGEFERVGGTQTVKVKVRVLAATNRNLEDSVREGTFRADLFYRLNVFPINVPPLRSRGNDIDLLVNYFAQKFRRQFHKPITSVSQASIDKLKEYAFPGNVRELQHLIERATLLSEGQTLHIAVPAIRPEYETELTDPSGAFVSLDEMEKRYIQKVLDHTNGIIAGKGGAAELLELPPSTLRSRMKKLGVK